MSEYAAYADADFASRKAVVLDANLLLLLAVGLWNPRAIATHKRTASFTVGDYELLREVVEQFDAIVTTPHVLCEVSNLAASTTASGKQAILSQLSELCVTLEERYTPATQLCAQPEFLMFGLTDAALSYMAAKLTLLTQDGRLGAHLARQGVLVFSLAQLRVLRSMGGRA